MKPVLASIFSVFLLLALFTGPALSGEGPKAVDSKEAYRMVMDSPSDTFIVDVRTQAEYLFVGHPEMPNGVPNIPYLFYPGWKKNEDFVEKVKERYSTGDTVITICRSGKRALHAAEDLMAAGFGKAYYMSDSFEGRTDESGHRTVDGWKVNGLPYTYELKDDLVYK